MNEGECCEGSVILLIDETDQPELFRSTDWKLAGPSSPIHTKDVSTNTTTTASQSTQGGCRGTVVGAVVVELESMTTDEADT